MEMQQIVEQLSIQKDMRDALLYRRGYLGQQLTLVEANEQGDIDQVLAIIEQLIFIDMPTLTNMELEATAWARRLAETNI